MLFKYFSINLLLIFYLVCCSPYLFLCISTYYIFACNPTLQILFSTLSNLYLHFHSNRQTRLVDITRYMYLCINQRSYVISNKFHGCFVSTRYMRTTSNFNSLPCVANKTSVIFPRSFRAPFRKESLICWEKNTLRAVKIMIDEVKFSVFLKNLAGLLFLCIFTLSFFPSFILYVRNWENTLVVSRKPFKENARLCNCINGLLFFSKVLNVRLLFYGDI